MTTWGILSNTNGNYSGLELNLKRLIDKGATCIIHMGNFIRPLQEIDDAIEVEQFLRTEIYGKQTGKKIMLDESSLKCLEILEKKNELFRALDSKKNNERYLFNYLKGNNELRWIKREYDRGRSGTCLYRRLLFNPSNISFLGTANGEPSVFFSFDGSQENLTQKITREKADKLFKQTEKFDDAQKLTKVCFVGSTDTQGAYEFVGRNLVYIPEREIIIEPGKSYIISPSNRTRGCAFLDDDSISLL